jgi:tetratricopeptide (TPR) repeat protein
VLEVEMEFEPDQEAPPTDRAQARARIVSELLDRRRVAQARPLIGAALSEDPHDLDMLYQAARADWLEDRHEDARARIADVLRIEPDHLGARFLLIDVLTETGELAEAEAQCLGLLEQYPRSEDLYLAYAHVMLRALQVAKASALVAEALRLAPNDAGALRMRAICDVVLGVRQVDSQAMQRLLVEHPEEQGTLAVLVVALAEAGRSREALRCARQLMLANPRDPHWIRTTQELTAATHWSMVPLRPLQRFGWAGSVALWGASIMLVRLTSLHVPQAVGWVSWTIISYCVYSWVWPPLFRKWVMRG